MAENECIFMNSLPTSGRAAQENRSKSRKVVVKKEIVSLTQETVITDGEVSISITIPAVCSFTE
jgi:hypothetical protein